MVRLKVTRDVLHFSTNHPTISLIEALKEEPLAYSDPEELISILKQQDESRVPRLPRGGGVRTVG